MLYSKKDEFYCTKLYLNNPDIKNIIWLTTTNMPSINGESGEEEGEKLLKCIKIYTIKKDI